jgi:hypothetical protein
MAMKIEVIGGDLKKGKVDVYKDYFLSGHNLHLIKDVKSMQQIFENDVRKASLGVAGAVVGGALLGPLGLIAGGILASKTKEICFTCELRDGRKFIATTNSITWKHLLVYAVKAASLTEDDFF